MFRKSYMGLAIFFIAALSSPMLMADINVTDIDGNWSSVSGGANVNGVGTNEIQWGETEGTQSGYVFTPSAVPLPVMPDVSFSLGTFTHNNFPIDSGTGITGATLSTDFIFNIDGDEVMTSMAYDFTHNETPNTEEGCCDDIVTALNNVEFSDTFFINGIEYEINILGFEVGNELLTEFMTPENASSSANLIAEINTSVAVPEASTYLIMASMLLLVPLFKKRKVKSIQ